MRILSFVLCVAPFLAGQVRTDTGQAEGGADDRFLSSAGPSSLQGRPQTTMARPTVHFEPNVGQVKGRTEWMAQAHGVAVYITGSEVAFALGRNNEHMRFVGASRKSRGVGIDSLGTYSNYFIGAAEKNWFSGVPHYGSVRYPNVYPGIDVVYHSSHNDVEYDFVLAPGANPRQIEMAFDREVHVDDGGDLVAGALRQHRPHVFQEGREVASEYILTRDNHVLIKLALYGRESALTIDPVLEFSTYLGGPGADIVNTVQVDTSGNIFLGGSGSTPATPTLDPFQQTNISSTGGWIMKLTPDAKRVLFYTFLSTGGAGLSLDPAGNLVVSGSTGAGSLPLKNAFQTGCVSSCGYVGKLSPDGRTVIFLSYLPAGRAFVDADGNIYVISSTQAGDLPIKNAMQPKLAGAQNCFISKISTSGSWMFSTYFGGPGIERCDGTAFGKDGSLILTGSTTSSQYPMKDAPQPDSNPGNFGAPVLVKMALDGQSLILSTYIGGENFSGWGSSAATDKEGNIYVTGRAFNPFMTLKNPYQTTWRNDLYGYVMKFDPTGKQLIYSTYFSTWFRGGLAVDQDENVYAVGEATEPEIALKNSFQDFSGSGLISITKFGASGSALIYSTLLGGTKISVPTNLFVDSAGSVYVTAYTGASDFPVKNAYQSTYGGGGSDGVLFKISDNSASAAASPLQLTPARADFQYVQGGPVPPSQSLAVTGTGSYFLTTSPTWIFATPSGPVPPNNVQVSVNPAGLAPGTYTGIAVLHPLSGAPAATIDVSVTVYAPAPVLTLVGPPLVSIGSDDVLVTITGSGFVSTTKLLVGGVPWDATPVTIVNSTTLTFKFPKFYFTGVTNYPITVQNPQSLASNGLSIAVGNPAPVIATGGILNAASYAPPPVAVGEMVVLFGSNFGSMDTTNVLFEHLPGKVIYVTPTQLVATVPAGAGNRSSIIVEVQTSHDVYSAPVTVDMAPAAPALFTLDASGKGQAAAINQDNTVNGTASLAPAGSIVAFYATGGGTLTTDALPRVSLPVSVTIGGLASPVLYAGVAPGQPDGMIQINVQVPAGVTPGAAEVVVKIGEASSQPGATLAVK
jgi:uncharacterized protein (TIGR03437 family)